MGREDYIGLYEIIWRLNTIYPDAAIGAKYSAADSALRSLLSAGHVRLFRGFSADPQSRTEPIANADHDELLRNPVSWYPGSLGHPTVTYDSTDTGELRYRELYQLNRNQSNVA